MTGAERCASGEHVWFNVVPGLDRCVRCDAEIVDLNADPIVVDFGGNLNVAGSGAEIVLQDIAQRWSTAHDRGAHDYTDAGCRVLAEHAFRDVASLLRIARAALSDTEGDAS